MKALGLLPKAAFAGFLVLSMMTYASLQKDNNKFTSDFMNKSAFKQAKRLDEVAERRVASSAFSRKSTNRKKVRTQSFPKKSAARNIITGEWQLYRFISSEDIAEDIDVVVDLDIVEVLPVRTFFDGRNIERETYKVRINEDNGQIFNISLFTEGGTIALWKTIGDSYEIIEGRRIQPRIVNVQETALVESNDERVEEEGPTFFVLDSALIPKKSRKLLRGELVSGELSVVNESIEYLEASVAVGTNDEKTISIGFEKIGAAGIFVSGDISGSITRNGRGYKVRFTSGPFKGVNLSFLSEDAAQKRSELSENELRGPEDFKEEKEENLVQEDEELESRSLEDVQEEAELSEEEMREEVERSGFEF